MENTLQLDLKNAADDVLELFEEIQVGDKVKIVCEYTVSEIDGERFHATVDEVDTVDVVSGEEPDDDDDDYEEEDEEEDEEDSEDDS